MTRELPRCERIASSAHVQAALHFGRHGPARHPRLRPSRSRRARLLRGRPFASAVRRRPYSGDGGRRALGGAAWRPGPKSALWLVPTAFVGAMAIGFAAALAGLALPFVEPVILASVIVIGLAAAVALNVPAGAAMAMVGFFAFFHGHAHGGESARPARCPSASASPFRPRCCILPASGQALGLDGSSAAKPGGWPRAPLAGAAALGGLWLAIA